MLNYLIQETLVLLLLTLNQKILTYLNRNAHKYTHTHTSDTNTDA